MIRVNNLTKRFGNFTAVDDVSFEIPQGEVFGFVGPNGAGKTTTMRIMATIDEPTSGDIFIDGYSVIDDPEQVRRIMGFMPDQYETYPNMTVWEFMDFYARAYGIRRRERLKRLNAIMEFTALDKLAEKEVNALSKGMRQRLCLGKTLIHDPKVIVMDEPAAGLDPRARIEFRELVDTLAGQGKTFLISSHILTELEEMVDGVAIIEQGQILKTGGIAGIRQELQSFTEIVAAFIGDPAPVERSLLEFPKVERVVVTDHTARFVFNGDAEERAALLKKLCADDRIKITEFTGKVQDLEEIFMKITDGKVQ
ncbi:MAG: multidrug ABC transporter ATP-binding protein [Planctomycetes bacterium RBG_16_59_8]|nr:MAG: multidrug ABC transporter ATP-binding protein [Planctomycetes bacterium RBG_16_59_8]